MILTKADYFNEIDETIHLESGRYLSSYNVPERTIKGWYAEGVPVDDAVMLIYENYGSVENGN